MTGPDIKQLELGVRGPSAMHSPQAGGSAVGTQEEAHATPV